MAATVKTESKAAVAFKQATRLHEILKLALADLAKCEKDDSVVIDMAVWHRAPADTDGATVCSVCLAGAVMHNRFEGNGYSLKPTDYPIDIRNKLIAINHLRTGRIAIAHEILSEDHGDWCGCYNLSRSMPLYGGSEWWPAMKKLLADLKEADI